MAQDLRQLSLAELARSTRAGCEGRQADRLVGHRLSVIALARIVNVALYRRFLPGAANRRVKGNLSKTTRGD
jgi:hypothetical protein